VVTIVRHTLYKQDADRLPGVLGLEARPDSENKAPFLRKLTERLISDVR